jgi:DNA-binding PadR family transcriptional regulator
MFRVNIFRRNTGTADLAALTPMEFEILLSLAGGARHGYAIIQDIAHRSDGTLMVRPGTLYRAIARLLEARIIAEVDGERRGDERRRYYAITAEGRRLADVEARRLERQVITARARRLMKAVR